MAIKQTTNHFLKICNETDLCCDKGVLRDPCCDPKNFTAINLLSKLCVDGSNVDGAYHCFDDSMTRCPYRNSLGLWAIVIIFIGVLGNLLTLLAIPYAARHRRHGLHENWYTITIFILHLAVCDLLYCGINLPFYVHVYMGYEWTFGEGWCVASIILAFLFSNADWMALALIAFNRALSVFHPKFLQDHCTKAKSMMAIIFSWILVLLILSPAFFEESAKFGYNCARGKCDLFETGMPSNLHWFGRTFPHVALVVIPFTIILGSYAAIMFKTLLLTRQVKKEIGQRGINLDHMDARNRQLTISILILCSCYVVFTFPHVIYGYTSQTYSDSNINYGFTLALFWLQYVINIAIYVGQRDQYWNAYKDYIREVVIPTITCNPGLKDRRVNESNNVSMKRVNELLSSVTKPLTSSRA